MSSRTQDKLQIFDSNSSNWKKHLATYIPENELPEKYGGRRKSQVSLRLNTHNNMHDIDVLA
jgi:hypothetical protein